MSVSFPLLSLPLHLDLTHLLAVAHLKMWQSSSHLTNLQNSSIICHRVNMFCCIVKGKCSYIARQLINFL